MTPQTASDLSKVLKEVWTEDSFKKAFDMEIQGSTLDLQRQMNRQLASRVEGGYVASAPIFTTVSTSPQAVRARQARQNEMMQLLAARQRKGKPSYRQRQKNGRAGRK